MPLAPQDTLIDQTKGSRILPIQPDKRRGSSAFTTWTRLTVGAMMVGLDLLMERARAWGEQVERPPTIIEGQSGPVPSGERERAAQTAHSQSVRRDDKGRQTLVGLLFDAEKHVSKNISALRRAERLVDRVTYPVMKGMRRQVLFRPIYQGFDRLVRRGETELGRWEEIGKIEEERSRELLRTATLTTVDTSIDYLSTNPDIQDLVQYQSTNLLNDLIEEVRERAVSVNTVIEGWVRKTLGLVPRNEIPGPPPEVRRRAELFPAANKRVS